MKKKTVRDIELKEKRVLMRADFNVPLDENLNITDDTRVRASLPTIDYVLEKGAKLILMSHLGRPKGKVVQPMSLRPVSKRLSQLLGTEVRMGDDCIGQKVKRQVAELKEGEVLLLENVRFHPEEEKNDEKFAQALANLGEIYVNDAFGTAHRAHASTEGVARFLPSVAGLLMEKEIEYLGRALESPARPFVAILGGAKVSDKIGVIENLLDKVDTLIIGGAMAYTFLKAEEKEIGDSLIEENRIALAKDLLERAEEKGVPFLLPVDHVIADKFSEEAQVKTTEADVIPSGWRGMDVGEKSIQQFSEAVQGAKTVLWNGPLGVFEMAPFSKGTERIAKVLSELKAITIIGGGDTVAAISRLGLSEHFTHISTGGGASLKFLEGKVLPGIAALTDIK